VHNLYAHTYVGTVLISRLYFYNLNLYIISAMTGKVQELYTRWKTFQNGLPAITESTVYFFHTFCI